MDFRLRPALEGDVPFARALYFETMRERIEPLFGWDERRQVESFGSWFDLQQARVIVVDGRDVGWVQTRSSDGDLFLGSLYVMPEMQRRGIGTHVVRELMEQARRASKGLTLAVMKNNPAIRLYERLGFQVTHEDEHKLYMRLRPASSRDLH